MKICSKCKIEKELMEFHKKPTGANGINSYCKKCHSENGKKLYSKAKEKIRQFGVPKLKKVCALCKIEKDEDSFSRHPGEKLGLASWCKKCKAQQNYIRAHKL